MLALDDFESADAAADDDAHAFGIVRIHLQAGLGERKFRGRNAELNKAAHLLDFFFLDEPRGVEILDLAGDAAIERRSVELFDSRNAIPRLRGWLSSFRRCQCQAGSAGRLL